MKVPQIYIYLDYNSSYYTILNRPQLPSIIVRQSRAIALEAFKILNNQTPVYLSDILTYKPHSHYLRYTNTVEVVKVMIHHMMAYHSSNGGFTVTRLLRNYIYGTFQVSNSYMGMQMLILFKRLFLCLSFLLI